VFCGTSTTLLRFYNVRLLRFYNWKEHSIYRPENEDGFAWSFHGRPLRVRPEFGMQLGVRRSFAVKIFMNFARAVTAVLAIITSNRRYRSALLAMPLAVSALLPSVAQAQNVWDGTGSTTTTTDYNLGTNWSSLPASAPPTAGGQSAVFGNTGSSTVTVTAGPITPDSWTFNANSQSYTVSGQAVNFNATGLTNNANAGQTISISNDLGGPGAGIRQLGASTLILGGTNSYTGATIVSAGTLKAGSTGAFSSSSDFTVNSTLDLNGFNSLIASLSGSSSGIVTNSGGSSATLTAGGGGTSTLFAGVIQDGTGGIALEKSGSGTLTLSGTNTYTGATTINAGTIALTGTGSIAASSGVNLTTVFSTFDISGTTAGASIVSLQGVSGSNVNLGTQTLTSTNSFGPNIFFGAINGSGGFTVSGGTQTLGGANTYTGVTTINSGAALGIEGTGSIATSSKVVNNGDLDISVTSSGTSIKSLAGTNSAATVELGNMTLAITAANDTYAGGIGGGGGTGGLTLTGGTETLTGSIGYTGATTINGGTLVVNSSLASSSGVTVNTGGTLTGAGLVAHASIAGGTFAPGSGTPGSSMTVIGALDFTAASTYAVNINPTTSSFANVTGTATLNGATVNATYASGSYVSKQYTILTAGVVSGSFGALVNTNLPANFSTSLSTDNKNAYLNLALNFTPTPPSGPTPPGSSVPGFGTGLNANQQNVGNTLTNFFNTTGGIPLVFGALTPAGLSQAAGETAVGTQQTTFNAMSQFMGIMTDPFIDGRGNGGAPQSGGASGYASTQNTGAARDAYAMFNKAPVTTFEQRWSTWIAGFGGSQTTDGNTALGSNSTTSSVYGTAVGADYRFSPDTIAGFSLAGGGTNFSVANSGTGHSDLFQAGAFVRHTVGPAYLSAALAYGWQDVTTNRTVTIAGIDQLRARFNANAWSGRVEAGYRFVTPVMGVTPYAAGQFTTFDLPSYAEGVISGSPAFALSYGAKSVTDARSELGVRTDKSWAMQDSILTLRGRVAWAHDYDPDRAIGATFQTLPGASFVVNGAAQAADSALTTASAEIKWINGLSVAATFEGEFSDVTRSYAGKGVVRYAW
jgi:autotransporter-associated beta strand protein